MGSLYKLKNSRENWKIKAVGRADTVRELRKENNRLRHKLHDQKKEAIKIKAQLEDLKNKQIARVVTNKASLIYLALQLFLVAGISFRAVSRVLSLISAALGLKKAPSHQTIINWFMRLSIVKMQTISMIGASNRRLFSNGFIWLVDISIGLGAGKILTVLALDAQHHRLASGAPTLKNVHCVGVCVADSWTGEGIAKFLKKMIGILGRPIAYLKDGGADLGKATRDLASEGFASHCIDDISHKIANLFKHEYESHPMFSIFLSACRQASKRLKQTLLACLAPPKISMKARFMNLHRLVKWADKILNHCVSQENKKGSLAEKLQIALCHLPQCKEFITDFLRDTKPLLACQEIIKNQGLNCETYAQCQQLIHVIPQASPIRIGFNQWAIEQLGIAKTLGMNHIGLPVSTDQIESLFGIGKHHGTAEIKDANRIAMRLPALCGTFMPDDAKKILDITVQEQTELMSGTTLIKQRRQVLEHHGMIDTLVKSKEIKQTELLPKSKNREKSIVTYCNVYEINKSNRIAANEMPIPPDPGSGEFRIRCIK
jgi:hypothetical protein